MKLKDLTGYSEIVIQGHDNPDADAIASCFGLYRFFTDMGKRVRMIYGGCNPVHKSNLVLMLEALKIPLEHVTELAEVPELLITVDCQYGERNVQKFPAREVAVIDHHPVGRDLPFEHCEVRDRYGACATLVWDLLLDEGFDPAKDEYLSTALYYGLYMDTGKLQELRHPKDRDLRDALEFRCRRNDLIQLFNRNISFQELQIAGKAMAEAVWDEENGFAIIEAAPCDPNILGIISDTAIEVDSVNNCLVYSILQDGVKLSLRSCGNFDHADELAAYLTRNVGSGGGHRRKAGGFISKARFMNEAGKPDEEQEDEFPTLIRRYLADAVSRYFREEVFICAKTDDVPDLTGCPVYEKIRQPIGYIRATDLYPAGSRIEIRMLEGDVEFTIHEDDYFIVGVKSEIYKNDAAYFRDHNDLLDEPYELTGEYAPKAHLALRAAGENPDAPKSLKDYVRTCLPKKGSRIYVKQLTQRTKVFPSWSENYMLGNPGDYLVARVEDPKRVYIIRSDILEQSYMPCGAPVIEAAPDRQ